jgi:hypothetical protein
MHDFTSLLGKMIMYITFTIGLVGCKSSSHVEVRKDVLQESISNLRTNQTNTQHLQEFLRTSITERLDGKIILWSDPDINGKQYKIADIDLSALRQTNIDQDKHLLSSDSTRIEEENTTTFLDKSETNVSNKSDSRLYNPVILTICLGIALIFMVWLIFKK